MTYWYPNKEFSYRTKENQHSRRSVFLTNEVMLNTISKDMRVLFYSQIRATVSTTKSKGNKPISGREGVLLAWSCYSTAAYLWSFSMRQVSKNHALNVLDNLFCPLGAVKNIPFQKLASLVNKQKSYDTLYCNICCIAEVWNWIHNILRYLPAQSSQYLFSLTGFLNFP